MTTFFKPNTAGDSVPNTTGVTLGIAALPGSTPNVVIPMRVNVALLGNWGTGNPVSQLKVQRIQGGAWYPVAGGSITNNGSLQKLVCGVAVRLDTPALTAAGTTTTAPRVAMHVENLLLPRHGELATADVSAHFFNGAVTTTNATLGSTLGFGRLNPDVPGLGSPNKSLVFVTYDGNGSGFVESTMRDSDGAFLVPETANSFSGSGQIATESFADEFHMNYTNNTGTDKVWIDVFKVHI